MSLSPAPIRRDPHGRSNHANHVGLQALSPPMHPRVSLVVVGSAVLSLLLILAIGALALTRSHDDASRTAEDSGFEGAIMPSGVRAPDFALRDESGRTIRMRELRGQPVIVTFLYTTCEDTCPIEAQQIRGALDLLDDEVPALAIAVNPGEDTPARAQRFLTEQRVYGRIRFVLGSRQELAPVWRGFFVQPQTEASEHQARVVLIDADGYQRIGFPGSEATPERLAHDVRMLQRESGRRP